MTYELLRVTGSGRHLIGDYGTYGAALTARCDDVLAELRGNGGWWTRAEHVIVGPGLEGPRTEHGLCTELGVDRDRTDPPAAADLVDAEQWLVPLHQP
jgi:hypothetical protein